MIVGEIGSWYNWGEKRFFGGAVSKMMKEYTYINLRQKPELKKEAARGFMINGECRRKLIWNVWKPI